MIIEMVATNVVARTYYTNFLLLKSYSSVGRSVGRKTFVFKLTCGRRCLSTFQMDMKNPFVRMIGENVNRIKFKKLFKFFLYFFAFIRHCKVVNAKFGSGFSKIYLVLWEFYPSERPQRASLKIRTTGIFDENSPVLKLLLSYSSTL